MATEPSKRAIKLLEKINETHDWVEGQVTSRGGTQLNRTDTCHICGLTRKYFSDSQNGVNARYTFQDHAGNELSLRDAAALKC